MPVEKEHMEKAAAYAKLVRDAKVFVALKRCKDPECGKLHAMMTCEPGITAQEIGDALHVAGWRSHHEDLPTAEALVIASIAHMDGLVGANTVVSVNGDTGRLGAAGVIEGLETLISRLRAEHNIPAAGHDENGAYL